MKPAPFEYHAPESLEEVVSLLREFGDDAKVIAGGQSLVPMMALRLARFAHLVDLRRVPGLDVCDRQDGTLRVGAMVRQAAVERDPTACGAVPFLADALPLVGHPQIRSRGTVCGSIAHADPASELPAVALALDAELELTGPAGDRVVGAAEFFRGQWWTALEPDEVLAAVRFPVWPTASGFAVEEVARRHGDFAIAGAAVGVERTGDGIRRAAVALFGMGSTPLRAGAAEAALVGGASALDAGLVAVENLDPPADVHASREYRRHVCAVMVERAAARALQAAR